MSHKKNYPSSNTAKLTKALFTTLCGHTLFTKKHASSKAMFSYLGWREKVTGDSHNAQLHSKLLPLTSGPVASTIPSVPFSRAARCMLRRRRPAWVKPMSDRSSTYCCFKLANICNVTEMCCALLSWNHYQTEQYCHKMSKGREKKSTDIVCTMHGEHGHSQNKIVTKQSAEKMSKFAK